MLTRVTNILCMYIVEEPTYADQSDLVVSDGVQGQGYVVQLLMVVWWGSNISCEFRPLKHLNQFHQ